MSELFISVVIISHNSEGIFQCITALKRQLNNNDEIIIVDDHSEIVFQKNLHAFCKKNNINIVHPEEKGNRAYNRNLGAKNARNPILVFVDADIILSDKSIYSIRRAHTYREEIAFIGTRYCARYDPYRMFLFSGIENLDGFLLESNDYDYLCDLASFTDKRYTFDMYVPGKAESNYYWIYYYSCCFSVLSDCFWKVGGFDSNFKGWGIEDIDLGYRLSLFGKLAFLENFKGIHIPHNRKLLQYEQENVLNLKYMLTKYQRFDVELNSIYRTTPEFLLKFKSLFKRMEMLHLSDVSIEFDENVIYINSISFKHPRGMLIYKNGEHEETYELLGLSTWFNDKSISKVILSGNVFLYPIAVICGILQESLRIGSTVMIESSIPKSRLDWSGFPNISSLQPQKRNDYRAYDLMEFEFNEQDNYIFVTSEIIEMNSHTYVPKMISADKINVIKNQYRLSKHYCVIDFTNNNGNLIVLNRLKELLNIDYLGIYTANFSNCGFGEALPNHLYSLFSINTPLIVIVEKLADFDYENGLWQNRVHNKDMIIDSEGKIIVF